MPVWLSITFTRALIEGIHCQMSKCHKFQFQCQNFKNFLCQCQNFKANDKCQNFEMVNVKCQNFKKSNVKCQNLVYQGPFTMDSVILETIEQVNTYDLY